VKILPSVIHLGTANNCHYQWMFSKPRFVSSYTIGYTERVGSEKNGDQNEEKCENKDRKE